MKYTLFLTLTYCIFLSSLLLAQTTRDEINREYKSRTSFGAEPGKCFAKCLIKPFYERVTFDLPVFNGINTDQKGVYKESILTKPEESKWIKSRIDERCESSVSNDCFKWTLKSSSAEYSTVFSVDTALIKEYDWQTFTEYIKIRDGGSTEWRAVVCDPDVTDLLISSIQHALKERNYYQGEITGTLDLKSRNALHSFQTDYGLPVGNLDYETLDTLEVSY